MKNRKWTLIAGILLSVIFSTIIYFNYWQSSSVACLSNLRIVKNESELKLLISYSLQDSSGLVTLSGTFFEQDKAIGTINRSATFRYTKNNDVYTLHSIDVARSGSDNIDKTVLSQFLPGFYLKENALMIMTITPQKKNGWIFSMGKVPSFYCEKSS